MASTALVLHRGAREVTREELTHVPLPAPTKTWAPVGHNRVLDTALTTIQEAGFKLDKMRLGLSGDGARFFGLCGYPHNPNCAESRIMRRREGFPCN